MTGEFWLEMGNLVIKQVYNWGIDGKSGYYDNNNNNNNKYISSSRHGLQGLNSLDYYVVLRNGALPLRLKSYVGTCLIWSFLVWFESVGCISV